MQKRWACTKHCLDFMTDQGSKSKFVDIVSWVLILLGGAGLAVGIIQFFAVLAMLVGDVSPGFFLAFVPFIIAWSGLLLWIGVGLRRRRPAARKALLGVLTVGALWSAYWLAAIFLRRALFPVPNAFVHDEAFRTPAIAMNVLFAVLYLFVLLRFSKGRIAEEFGSRDA